MKTLKSLILLLCLTFTIACQAQALIKIKEYQRIFLPLYAKNGDYRIAIRVFKRDDVLSFLLVNPTNLTTEVASAKNYSLRNPVQLGEKGKSAYATLSHTLYYCLLTHYVAAPYKLENQGLTHAQNNTLSDVLTIDLCPSVRPFEKDFFQELVALSIQQRKPIPITIAISGLWMIEHPHEFAWLQQMKQTHHLQITWANHSFSHVYYHDLPYEKNFMLTPMTNLEVEILLPEQLLLEQGETPSVFFRFPGLVSSPHLLQCLEEYGLIPLGANAWLAKEQPMKPGAFILVHGNGNEHKGIVEMLPYLHQLKFIDIYSTLAILT